MLKIGLVFILFIILGGLFAYQNFFLNKDIKTDNELMPVMTGANTIYVADQRPGSFLIINLVKLNEDGYVVIHENIQGELGQIIGGTKILSTGESAGVSASLIRPVSHGESLFAVIHEDSGDDIFSPNLDIPILDEEGNMVFMIFYIDQNAPEIQNQKVIIDQTDLPNKKCLVTGCSGQICAEEDMVTTCEFIPEYSCYKTARCERQSDGQCGWTATIELASCLGN